jgi:hypothetical protein
MYNSGTTLESSIAFDPYTSGKFIVTNNNAYTSGRATIGNISGTTITYGTTYVYNSAYTPAQAVSFDPNTSNQLVIAYQDGGNSNYGTAIVGTVSGTALTFGAEHIFNSDTSIYVNLSFDPNTAGKFVLGCQDANAAPIAIVAQAEATVSTTNLTATNLLGISAEAITSGATGKINTWGGLNEGQSSLTPASIYYVQGNGTISTVATAPAQKIGQAMSATTLNIKDL